MTHTKVRDGLVVQWPDTHVPDHHRGAVRNLIRFIGDVQPKLVLLTGDFFDLLSTARWTKDTIEENGRLFQKEIDAGTEILWDLRDVYSGRIAWLPGNHEARLAKWGRTRGRAVFGLDFLTIPFLAGFDALEIETPGGVLEPTTPWEFAPGVLAIHGEAVRKHAGASVLAEMERLGSSVIMGHTHRLALVHHTTHAGTRFGIEGGHVMDQKRASYLSYGTANWQMGFSVIEVSGGRPRPQVVPMAPTGAFDFQGERYA